MQDDTVRRPRIDLVIGTRPNIVKAAPLLRALDGSGWSDPRLVFLMQHTDDALAKEPLEDLGIPRDRPIYIPLVARGLGKRLGEMIEGYGAQLDAERPDLVVVFGDVDTTLAATYAAKRAGLTVAHIEAGLRSRDRAMPEEPLQILAPVVVGDTIRAEIEVTALRPTSKNNRAIVTSRIDVFNQRNEMVMTYTATRMLAGRPQA